MNFHSSLFQPNQPNIYTSYRLYIMKKRTCPLKGWSKITELEGPLAVGGSENIFHFEVHVSNVPLMEILNTTTNKKTNQFNLIWMKWHVNWGKGFYNNQISSYQRERRKKGGKLNLQMSAKHLIIWDSVHFEIILPLPEWGDADVMLLHNSNNVPPPPN